MSVPKTSTYNHELDYFKSRAVIEDSHPKSISSLSLTSVDTTNSLNFDGQTIADIGPEIFSNPEILPKIKPFQATKVYGLNTNCNIINLSRDDGIQLFYSAEHLGVLYDYCKDEYKFFEGHKNSIVSISNDDSGNYVVTCDSGEDSCVIIWSIMEKKPVFTIFNPYPKSGCLTVRLSYDAKYLVTIGQSEDEEHHIVSLWAWTYGLNTPHHTINVKASCGKPKKICFNPTLLEHCMIIFERQVIFVVINPETLEFTNIVYPHITFKNVIGKLQSGTYIERRHRCFATSENGYVLIFANTLYLRAYTEGSLDNAKIYLKAIKISNSSLVVCKGLEELIALGDFAGRIYLMDLSLTIKYYYEKPEFAGLVSFSFNTVFIDEERDKRKQLAYDTITEQGSINFTENSFEIGSIENRCDDILNQVYPAPSDYTVHRKPIVVKPMFLLNNRCGLYYIEYFKANPFPIFPLVEAPVTSFDIHANLPLLLIGHENGQIQLTNYEENKLVAVNKMVVSEDHSSEIDKPEAITCLKYSNESLHLVCSNNTGEIFVLDTILLKVIGKKPIRVSMGKIIKIEFNFDSSQFAYYDYENTVVIFKYNSTKEEWIGMGKLVPHYLPINDMLFIPEYNNSTLVTIGEDRCIVKYNNVGLNIGDTFDIIVRERIEQSSIPKSFVHYTKNVGADYLGYYTIADDQYKYKSVNDLTMMTREVALGPAYGAFKGHFISKLMFPESLKYQYYIFKIDKQIGLQKATLDGNPYSYVGYKAHPSPVADFVLSHDGKYIFTFSEGSKIIFMWEIRTKAVELVYLLGGREFEPYYCLLEGGKNGWLFQEIQDLFFYMQILHQGENVVLPRKFSDTIDISELPDLVRACGYYPSEFEIENLMIEARYRNIDETSQVNLQISFFEFLKLYVNHRPAHGYKIQELQDTFTDFANISENLESGSMLLRDEYISILGSYGEPIPLENLRKCFSTLCKTDQNMDDKAIFPESMSFDSLLYDILGVEMEREKVEDDLDDDVSIISLN